MARPETDIEYSPERIFVQALTGQYYSLYEERQDLRDDNRVIQWADTDWEEKGEQMWNKDVFGSIQGGDHVMGKTQSLQVHIIELAPEGESQQHAHQNEALMYILEGRGYEIHDGKKYEWEPGDLALIHGGCVHKHYSADPDNPARVLVIKAKPIYLFLNLLYQGYVERAPDEPVPGQEDHEPDGWGSPNQIKLDDAHKRAFDRVAQYLEEDGSNHDHTHSHDHTHTGDDE